MATFEQKIAFTELFYKTSTLEGCMNIWYNDGTIGELNDQQKHDLGIMYSLISFGADNFKDFVKSRLRQHYENSIRVQMKEMETVLE